MKTNCCRTFAIFAAAGLAASISMFTSNAYGQFADALLPPFAQEALPAPAIPLSKVFGAAIPGPINEVVLDAIDHRLLLAEDAAVAAAKNPLRLAVGRELLLDAAAGEWFNVAGKGQGDGRLWVAQLRLDGATTVRLHLTEMNLPEGARLAVYAPARPTAVSEYAGRGQWDTGEMYVAPVEGDTVRIEYYAPPAHAQDNNLPFIVDSAQHYYRDPREAAGGGHAENQGVYGEREGNCHNDVTCSPTWANAAKAVGKLTFVQNGSSFLCTGSLLSSTAADYTPYLLTANHCMSTNAVANTVVVYWLFQTSICNSGSPANGPTSTGCTLLHTNATGDMTLMMVEGTVPRTQVTWLGWDAAIVANGTPLTSIHHPTGAYKRISFGTAQANTADHIRCNWTSGVTEGGSSGSPLMISATQRVIGDLTGGPSACGAGQASLYDTYGYFNYNYNNDGAGHPLQALLATGSDDAREPNDSCAAAVTLASTSNPGMIVKWNDEDWYRFSVAPGATLSATATYIQANGDVDLQLYSACGGSLLASTSGTIGTDTVSYLNNTPASVTLFLRAYLTTDVRNTYSLSYTNGGGGSNDLCSAATSVSSGNTYTGTTATATNDGTTSCGTSNTTKDRWYTFTAPGTGTLSLNTCGSAYDTVLSVHTGCPGTSANSIKCNDDAAAGGPCAGSASALTQAVTAGTSYKVRVGGYNGASGNFTLTVAFAPTVVDNNNCVNAIATAAGQTYTGTTATATNDGQTSCGSSNTSKDRWYKFVAPSSGTMTVDTCGSAFDTVLSLHSACGGTSANSLNCNDDATAGACASSPQSYITRSVIGGTTYYIRVAGYNAASGNFNLRVNFSSPRLAFDSCSNALPITDGSFEFSNSGASTDGPDEPAACDFFGYTHVESDVWFSYNSICEGPVNVTTCGSNFDTKLSVYAACPTQSGASLACNDDAPVGQSCNETLQSAVTFNASAGATYLIRVGGYQGAIGDGFLNVSGECGTVGCAADFNADGGVDGTDVSAFFTSWQAGDNAADVDLSGGVDGEDVAFFFIAWQAGGC